MTSKENWIVFDEKEEQEDDEITLNFEPIVTEVESEDEKEEKDDVIVNLYLFPSEHQLRLKKYILENVKLSPRLRNHIHKIIVHFQMFMTRYFPEEYDLFITEAVSDSVADDMFDLAWKEWTCQPDHRWKVLFTTDISRLPYTGDWGLDKAQAVRVEQCERCLKIVSFPQESYIDAKSYLERNSFIRKNCYPLEGIAHSNVF